MASFDFVEAAGKGYQFVWEKREAVLAVALVPFLIKLFCFLAVTAFADEGNYLRHGLYLIPSYFAEGWLMAQLIRMAIFNERWPGAYNGNPEHDRRLYETRKRAILSSMIIYVLIKLTMAFLSGYVLMAQTGVVDGQSAEVAAEVAEQEPSMTMFLLGVAVFMSMIWAFRLAYLYVPAAMDFRLGGFLERVKPYMFSVVLIGTWMLCFVPVALALVMISKLLMMLLPGSEDSPSVMFTYAITVVQAMLEMLAAILSSVAVAYGIKTIYDGTNKSRPLF